MNGFVVEAVAETNPFNPNALHQTLLNAASGDRNQLQSATKQLQQWESKEGYHSALQDVFLQQEQFSQNLRMLSIIQLKNGVDKYWRKTASNAIRADERTKIRDRLLQGSMVEPIENLASMNAIVTAKIARYDFPGQWPDLISQLLDLIRSSVTSNAPGQDLSRALLITNQILKELGTIRLQRQRAALLSAAPKIFHLLRECYLFKSQEWQSKDLHASELPNDATLQAMHVSQQTLKVIRRLVTTGYDYPHRNEEVVEFWDVTINQMQQYVQMMHSIELQPLYRETAIKLLKQLGKMHLIMAKDHNTAFALLPNSVNLVKSYWAAAKEIRKSQLNEEEMDSEWSEICNSFNIKAILILRACFKETRTLTAPFKYRNTDHMSDPPQARKILTEELLTRDFVTELFQTLVSNFFIYLTTDVEEFFSEPEEWEIKDEGDEDAYDQSVRAASERLFLDICLHHKDVVIEPLLQTINSVSVSNDARTPLYKDAIYAAIGVAAPVLNKKFDFNTFLKTTLVKDFAETNKSYSIVRRRIALLLAMWAPVDISDDNRPLVYEMFQSLLIDKSGLNNLAVRTTAGKHLQDIVDEMSFKPEVFAPYASSLLSALLDLIEEVIHGETKLALLNTVSTVVERMDSTVAPFSSQIMGILQTLWMNSGDQNMMKAVIVTIITKLFRALKAESAPLHPLVLPIVNEAVTPGSDSQVYLLDDALDLWASIIKQTPTPTSGSNPSTGLLDLLPHVLACYELDDAVLKALKITRSYILLSPTHILNPALRIKLFESSSKILTSRDIRIPFAALDNVNLLIRAAFSIGQDALSDEVTRDMMSSELLFKVYSSLNSSWETKQETGPKKRNPPSDWRNETDYLVLLSHVILTSLPTFLKRTEEFAISFSLNLESFMRRLLDECFSHMDAVARPTDSKLICLGLTKLLQTNSQWILEKLQDLMTLWTSSIVELRDPVEDKDSDSLVYPDPPSTTQYQVPEAARDQQVTYSDPIHTMNLGQFVRFNLQLVIENCGGEAEFQNKWLVNVDKEVVKAFSELGIM